MKKVVLFLVIIAMTSPIFAQDMGTESWDWDGNRQMAVMINPWPLFVAPIIGGFGVGAAFEVAPTQFISIKPYINILYLDLRNNREEDRSLFMLRFSTEGRWYPQGHFVHGFFTNLGLQYHLLNLNLTDVYIGTFHTLGIFWGVGHKFVLGRGRAAFVFEPTLDYIWTLTTNVPSIDPFLNHTIGWLMGTRGFRFGLKVGVVF